MAVAVAMTVAMGVAVAIAVKSGTLGVVLGGAGDVERRSGEEQRSALDDRASQCCKGLGG